MPPYIIEKTPTRRKLIQAVVHASNTHGGIAGGRVYHFPPAHNRPNVPVSFKRTRIARDPQQDAYCICVCLQYSKWLDWKVILWEHQYFKLNNALSTAIFRFRYLRSRICEARRMKNLVCMEVLGKLKTQKMNGGTEVPILARYEGNIPANQAACEFASALTLTMNGFKNSPHLDKDASQYASGWWFQADKQSGQIKRDASKWCTGGKLIFPKEHFWIDLSACHGFIQVVWASSTFVHYTDPAQDNESMTLVGMSAQCSSRLAKTMCQKSHGYHEIGERAGYQLGDGNTISCQFIE
ncbi:hypothetical protein O181_096775 [Austropuccinia psidii MF-1]|uniref:Tet-like 2OG-Fe(II) oxygenase domain-containing protein n=1 Tax=Austropuccinia psidii MF-1 TaxID=1389203 RepID=A0A9Q3PDB2_9BASI|nr:hypothetical protein [Austropuccinia psidii MF-1]